MLGSDELALATRGAEVVLIEEEVDDIDGIEDSCELETSEF